MRLRSLELFGFKSFLEPCVVHFPSDLSVVVGPNGCGKSNLTDAIRWVLGEQAASRLRGRNAEDLLYAGSESRPPAAMAEVTLVLEASERAPLPQPYDKLSELSIARRLYRSGEGEYLINKVPCRLRDISELFMAAGISSRSYALVAQGQIEEVIQARPADLRVMVEQAADLALFKERREISEQKLERTRRNLARLEDIAAETERQMALLRRQAKRAEAFKVLRDEMRELQRLVATRRIVAQHNELAQTLALAEQLGAQAEHEQAEAERLGADSQAQAQRLANYRERLSTVSRELDKVRARIAERTRSREILSRRLEEIARLTPELTGFIAQLERRLEATRAERAARQAELAVAEAAGAAAPDQELAELRQSESGLRAELERLGEQEEEAKDELAELMRQAATSRGHLAGADNERLALERECAALAEEVTALGREIEHGTSALATLNVELEKQREELTHLEQSHRAAQAAELSARASLSQAQARMDALQERILTPVAASEPSSQPHHRRRLEAVLQLLQQRAIAVAPAFIDEMFELPAPLKPALKRLWGDNREALFAASPEPAVQAVELLKKERAGRVSILLGPQRPSDSAAPHFPGMVARLLDAIKVRPGFEQTAEALVGNVLIVEDLAAALRAWQSGLRQWVFVTAAGDLFRPGQIVHGGAAQDQVFADPAGQSQRQQPEPAAALAREVERLEGEVKAAAAEQQRQAERRAARRAEVGERARAATSSAGALAQAEARKALLEDRAARLRSRLEELRRGRLEAEKEIAALGQVEEAAAARLESLESQRAALRAEHERLAAETSRRLAVLEGQAAARRALERDVGRLDTLAGEMAEQALKHRASLEGTEREGREFETELARISRQEELDRAAEAELASQADQLARLCSQAEHEATAARQRAESAAQRRTRTEAQLHENSLRGARARALWEELGAAFREQFGADFETVREESAAALAGRDAGADEQRLAEIKERLDQMGDVNMGAQHELAELAERAGALAAERADLQAAVKDLSTTVQRLNREARERFEATFQAVARNFTAMLPRLMPDATGRLELLPGEDDDSAGINVLIQPKGKKIRGIGLLSGGERALCTLAFIFSLFLLNPSPFCVLDEVDAPLDEASIGVFTSLVGELKERTQFIVISHNQRTIQCGEQVLGVTMEEPGISKLAALKLPEAA
jgi:chromosome segregation protein